MVLALIVKSPGIHRVRHFTKIFAKCSIPADYPFPSYLDPVASDLLTVPIIHSEVRNKLARLPNSAQGPDGFKSSRRSIGLGKTQELILIYKKGDPLDITNLHPDLAPEHYGEVFSPIIALKPSSWTSINDPLSPFQEGFR
ncbi:hypothetical protein TNIN_125491 [Trichonephila inaurata madagascariensis]|uniref:Uncharacterized protein n=1 Tax=Trichonephila inaurata madagascariensis TaxID=2747483 RepID=A0A8X6XS84_9ARAC|nr:hypothetical protein TNIN_125491 [Trichonephila inaurata madagascariensis]